MDETILAYIRQEVSAGFKSAQEIETATQECFSDEFDLDEALPEVKSAIQEAFTAHLQAQTYWPEVTDCDRLDGAFRDLEANGIISRQNFSCCGTCGAGEIWDEMQKAAENGAQIRGYTFYHMQDTESAVAGYGLYLNYGSVNEDKNLAMEIPNEIVETLAKNGLRPAWNGDWSKRIFVPLDWKRRRDGQQ